MKTRLRQIFLCIVIPTLLTGCASVGDPQRSDITIPDNSGYQNMGALHQVSSWAGADIFAASEKGVYEPSNPRGTVINILFNDFETKQQVFLCNKPECKHLDESCLSAINIESSAVPGLVYAGNRLLLIRQYPANNGNSGVVVSSPDGSERKTLFELPSNESMPGIFFSDGQYLLFTKEVVAGKALARGR